MDVVWWRILTLHRTIPDGRYQDRTIPDLFLLR